MTKPVYSIDAPDQQRLKIEAVLKEHDLSAVVVLHTPGMTEFFYDIRPSYSCAWVDEAAGIVRVKSKLADYCGDAVAQQHDRAATANMAHGFALDLTHAATMFMGIAKVTDRAFGSEHTASVHTPDPRQGKPS